MLFLKLKDWNWQTKDAPLTNLIRTLVEMEDEQTAERINGVLMGSYGYLKIVLSSDTLDTRQMGVYSARTLRQRYQDLLKHLCSISRVQEFVLEKSSVDDNYRWLHKQIEQLYCCAGDI